MSSLFCGKESGLETPPTSNLTTCVIIILHLWYWCQIFLQKKFCSSVGFCFALPNLHLIIHKNVFFVKFFCKEILDLRVGGGLPSMLRSLLHLV